MDFRLLGPLEVREHGRSLPLGGPKQRSLLAVLLLHAGEVVARDRLIDALWGPSPPVTVAKSVQMYVSRLRKQLGDERLETRSPGYLLRVDPSEFDLACFERLVAESARLEPRGAAAKLREALALWRGPPLADLAYEPFAQTEIARLEDLRLAALERRLDADLEAGRHAELVGELEALVAEQPLRESLRGRLMLALYRSGRQADALAAYAAARARLVGELGIEPGHALRELHQAVLAQDRKLDAAPARTAAAGRPGFVGREQELAELAGCFDGAAEGRGALVLLSGEPGIGKSRLADELVTRVTAEGAQVLVGRSWEAGGAPAYWPWTQALRAAVRRVDREALIRRLGPQAPDAGDIVPELRVRRRGPPADPEGARVRRFDAVVRLLDVVTGDGPAVLVLDDLHAADGPSLLLLRYLTRELAPMRLLVIGAYRDVAPVPGADLRELLAEVSREPVTRRLPLRGLGEPEVEQLVRVSSPAADPRALAAAVHETTDGNPLFVGELVRLFVSTGSDVGCSAIPPTVRDVIAQRLARLSPGCRQVVRLASVLGREFPLDVLGRMAGDANAEDLPDGLDEAIAERVVTAVPGSPGRFRFEHVLIRDALYDGLGPARRARMHAMAVSALHAVHGAGDGPHLADLAAHALAAGANEQAGRFAREGAVWALAQLAHEEAARLFQLALTALDRGRRDDPSLRCDLLLATGDALARAGRPPQARATFLTACDVARTAGLHEHLAHAALGYGGRCLWQRAGGDDRLVPLLDESLATLGDDDSSLRARLLARMAGARRDEPALEPRAALSREAVAIARRLGDTATLVDALVAHFMAIWGPDIDELAPIAAEVARLARDSSIAEQALDALTLQSIIGWTTLGQADTATLDDEYGELAAKLKQPIHQWQGAMVSTASALFRGDLADAERLAAEARGSGHARGPDAECSYRLAIILLRREQGRLAELEELIRDSPRSIPGYRAFPCFVVLLECEVGRERAARTAFRRLAEEEFAALPRDGEWLFCLALLSEAAAHLRERTAAEVLHRLMAPYAELNAMAAGEVAIGSVARYAGIAAATAGCWDAAERLLEDAIAANARMGARPWLAHSRADLAQVLLARDAAGDRRRAGELLAAAAASYAELGIPQRLIRRSGTGATGADGEARAGPKPRSRAR